MIRGCFISCRWNSTFLFVVCWLLFVTLLCSHTVNCHFIDIYYFFVAFCSVELFCVYFLCAAEMLGKSNENIKILNQSHSLHRVLYHRNFFFVLVTELFHNVIQYPSKNQNNQKEMRFCCANRRGKININMGYIFTSFSGSFCCCYLCNVQQQKKERKSL